MSLCWIDKLILGYLDDKKAIVRYFVAESFEIVKFPLLLSDVFRSLTTTKCHTIAFLSPHHAKRSSNHYKKNLQGERISVSRRDETCHIWCTSRSEKDGSVGSGKN